MKKLSKSKRKELKIKEERKAQRAKRIAAYHRSYPKTEERGGASINESRHYGYKMMIAQRKGVLLYDGGSVSIAYFNYPEDTRYYVRCEFPVPVGLHSTSSPELWTSDEKEAQEFISDPEKALAWIRERINSDPRFSRYANQPIIETDHELPNYGGHPTLLVKTPQYIIFRCHWPASEEYWLASDHHALCDFDSTPMWSYTLTKEQAEDLLAHPEKIIPFYCEMQKKYPLGH